ncbi:TetR/AcrR family transcriptional regulator [Flavihumibacter fluvii]|uniref:TetR/AcrR family transcriptional regulator n=1 Tax=Flavihumibacter fluvii TaxID=2838157 RepID=UPI001BDE9DC0|nr:TetR/AcrR family transcriptional regulator [Flavihumibacter fluvii]ULQ51274.1 TetR/AcrR family transcriptional regulator [Flavihumibacter fluvii]
MSELDNKERILAKASQLFMQFGIRSVSMDDIASALGVSKKTIYQFFADKDELVSEVIKVIIAESEECCEVDRTVAENAVDEMFKAMEMVEEMFRTMNPAVLHDLKKYHPAAFGIFDKHKNDYVYNIIRDNLVRGIQEELYRPELNIEIITLMRIDSMMLPFNPTLFNRQDISIVQISQQILEHYLFGIVSLKGYKLVLKYQQQRQKK